MIGYDRFVEYFQKHHRDDSLSHSYLFFGQERIGKRSFALAIAHMLECGGVLLSEAPNNGSGLQDTLFISREEGSIDSVRNVKRFLSMRPVKSSHRTVIIDAADALNIHAQHALLKTMEDANEHALIMLIASNASALQPTILSRCVSLYVAKPSRESMYRWIRDTFSVSNEKARELYILSSGRPGRVVELVQDKDALNHMKDMSRIIGGSDMAAMMELIASVAEHKDVATIDDIIHLACMTAYTELSSGTKYDVITELLERHANIRSSNANVQLQLEAALGRLIEARKT